MKRIALALFLIFFAFLLFSCKKDKDEKVRIGICQLVQHNALDEATRGFMDSVKSEFGEKVEFDLQNASGEINNCTTIVNSFKSKKVDLILANATPALQAAAAATDKIPIIGTSVTNYAIALDIDMKDEITNRNITGTSDLSPLDQQANLIEDFFPKTKLIALLYCSAEANSIFQIEKMEEELNKRGFSSKRFSFADTSDLNAVVQSAAREADVLYVPTDNTLASNTELINNVASQYKVPVIVADKELLSSCGFATVSIDYYNIGYKAGNMAVRILKDKEDISKMPIEYSDVKKYYNKKLSQEYNITPASGYEGI